MTRRDVALLILILLLGGVVTTAQKIRRGLHPNIRVEGLEFLEPRLVFDPANRFDLRDRKRRKP